jgi:hypothetical protein
MSFLAEQVKLRSHQVVISTHSPEIVRDLPPKAIKVFLQSKVDGRVELLSQKADPTEAFFRLGVEVAPNKTIFVEDGLAAALVARAIRPLGEAVAKNVNIVPIPGGTNAIQAKFIPAFAIAEVKNCLILLDGDQRPTEAWPHPDEVSEQDLEDIVTRLLHGKVELSPNGSNGRASVGERSRQLRKVLSWCVSNVDYLPGQDPESLLWKLAGLDIDPRSAKREWASATARALGYGDWERPTSAQILTEQQRSLAKVDDSAEELQEISNRVMSFFEATRRGGA